MKTKILILQSCAGEWGAANEGEIIEVDVSLAQALIRGGLAMPENAQAPAPDKSTDEPRKRIKKG